MHNRHWVGRNRGKNLNLIDSRTSEFSSQQKTGQKGGKRCPKAYNWPPVIVNGSCNFFSNMGAYQHFFTLYSQKTAYFFTIGFFLTNLCYRLHKFLRIWPALRSFSIDP